jgi:hypothetical protein
VVRIASVNCSESRDISCYLYGYVRDRKVVSAIACRRADAINHGGASIAPPGTDRRKAVQSINARQVLHKWGTIL